MSVEIAAPVELVAPLATGVELRHTPTSNYVLRLITAAMILATVTVVMLGRPGGTLADSSQVTIAGP